MALRFPARVISIAPLRNQLRKTASLNYSTGHAGASEKTSYWKSLKWFSIPASVGFAYIAYLQFRHIQKRERRNIEHGSPESLVFEQWQVDILKKLPTRVLSRWWGYLSHLKVPLWLRKPLFGLYVSLYDCDMNEAMIEDLRQFPTFSEFFKRKLRPDVRIVDQNFDIISPVDGKVLYFGEVGPSYNMEQVKGVTYSLVSFCGPKHPLVRGIIKAKENLRKQRDKEQVDARNGSCDGEFFQDNGPGTADTITSSGCKEIPVDRGSKLYYCIMYLAPGDYHWFHSPTDWVIEHRRHIPGHLFSVSPAAMRSVAGLFNFNERVLLHGHWKHGQFLMAAIGAYNVGSINLPFAVEKNFKTNVGKLDPAYNDRLYGAAGFSFQRGEPLGGFDLGSSIVMIFTAPDNLKFQIEPGQKIKYGEPVASLKFTRETNTTEDSSQQIHLATES